MGLLSSSGVQQVADSQVGRADGDTKAWNSDVTVGVSWMESGVEGGRRDWGVEKAEPSRVRTGEDGHWSSSSPSSLPSCGSATCLRKSHSSKSGLSKSGKDERLRFILHSECTTFREPNAHRLPIFSSPASLSQRDLLQPPIPLLPKINYPFPLFHPLLAFHFTTEARRTPHKTKDSLPSDTLTLLSHRTRIHDIYILHLDIFPSS